MKVSIALLVPALAAAVPASASSDAAWAAFDRRVAARCIAASGLQDAHASAIVGFDDTLGKVATLVGGRRRVRGRAGPALVRVTMLCIHDKRTGRSWVDETGGWSAPGLR